MNFIWWITAIELPVLGGLFWLLQSHRGTMDREFKALRDDLAAITQVSGAIHDPDLDSIPENRAKLSENSARFAYQP